MALQGIFNDEFGSTWETAYACVCDIDLCVTNGSVRTVIGIFKDAEARADGKRPLKKIVDRRPVSMEDLIPDGCTIVGDAVITNAYNHVKLMEEFADWSDV